MTEAAGAAGGNRGWHRAVGWPALIGVSLLTALCWLALVVTVWGHVRNEWLTVVALSHQPLGLRLPAGLQAQARIERPVAMRVRSSSVLQVAVDQTVQVRVLDELKARVQVDAVVPVRTQVEVVAQVPVETELTLQVPVLGWLPRFTVVVPLSAVLPVRVSVPVAVDVPVVLDAQVQVRLPQGVQAPVKARFQVPVVFDQPLQAQVLGETLFTLEPPVPLVGMSLEQARLLIPLRQFGWQVR